MKLYTGILVVLVLSGCATSQNDSTGGSPADRCRNQGFREDSDEYKQCVDAYLDEYCKSQGLTLGSDEFVKCMDSSRNATFLRNQMQIRGF